MLLRVSSGILGLGLIVALILYATQVGKTNEANDRVSSLTLNLGTANDKITSLTAELTASGNKVTTLTAELAVANGKVNSLTSDLGAANGRVTTLTADLATANGRVTSLTASLSAANANITRISTDLTAAQANATRLGTDLAAAQASVTRLTADLASANANVTRLTADLAAANANVARLSLSVANLTAELKSAEDEALVYALALTAIAYPRHFNSLQELTSWLASDDTNTAYPTLRGSEKSFILQVRALQDGLIIGARVSGSSNGTVYYGNVAIVGGSIYAVNPATDQIILEGTTNAYPMYPIPIQ